MSVCAWCPIWGTLNKIMGHVCNRLGSVNLGMSEPGNLEIWEFGHLETWESENHEISEFGNHKILLIESLRIDTAPHTIR